MSHGAFRAETAADAVTTIVTQMKLAGWTDDGAPSVTILKSVSDSEGRAAYVQVRETTTPGGITFVLGDSRSGDSVLRHNGLVAGVIVAAAFFAARWFTLTISDRWVNYHSAADKDEYAWAFCGAFETPLNAATQRACIFYARGRNDAMTTIVTQIDRYGSSGNYYATNSDDTGTAWLLTIHSFIPGSTGLKQFWSQADGHAFGYRQGIGCYSYPWWFITADGFFIIGYVKDARLVHNATVRENRMMNQPVIYDNSYWYLAANERESATGGSSEFALYLRGEPI